MDEEQKVESTENGSGISLREIWRNIGKKIWYVLSGSIILAIVVALVFMFLINPGQKSQSMSFRINYPMSDQGKYPDGSTFNYRDIISWEVIEAVKNDPANKDEFASIDTGKFFKDDGIQISAHATSSEPDTSYIYTVTVKSSCLEGVDAEKFIYAMTEAFKSEIIAKGKIDNLDYKIDGDIFRNASFKDQLTLLSEQKNVILGQYDNWIKEYSAGYVASGKSLSAYRADVITMLADNVKTPIENDLSFKGFEYFNSAAMVDENGNITDREVKTRVEQLYDELEFNRAALDELRKYYSEVSGQAQTGVPYSMTYAASDETGDGSNSNGGSIIIMPGDSNLSQRIAYYSERTTIINQQILYLTSKCESKVDIQEEMAAENLTAHEVIERHDFTAMAEEIKEFGEKLDKQLSDLQTRAETLTRVVSTIYDENTVLIFDSLHATSEGGTSILIVAIGVFVVSFIVFAMIAFAVGKKSSKPQKSAPAEESKEETGKTE